MFTPDDKKGNGEHQFEPMTVKIGAGVIPIIEFEGGCDTCRMYATALWRKLLSESVRSAATVYEAMLENTRENTKLEGLDKGETIASMEKLAPGVSEFIEKLTGDK